MRRLRLSTLLIGLNVGLFVLAVAGVAVVAVRLLRQLADEQALARVAQAGVGARNTVSRAGYEILNDAQLLSERPTLLRLLQSNDLLTLNEFLTQFQQTSQRDAAAVLQDGRVVAQSGRLLAWEALWAAHQPDPNYFFESQASDQPLILGAWAEIPSLPGSVVLVAVELNDAFTHQVSEEIGLPVTIAGAARGTQASSALQAQVLASGETRVAQLGQPERYVAALPLRGPTGAVAGVITTELSAADVTRSVSQLVQTFLWLTLGLATLAALASFVLGRRLALPLQRLTAAAARIGKGDLTIPILRAPREAPLGGSAEIGMLALTFEEMRRRLLQVTADLRSQQAESNAILTGIVEGVFTVDGERRLQYMNPQAAAMLGVPAESVMGRFCGDVLNPQGSNGVRPCEEDCPIVHARVRVGARATEYLLLPNGQRRTVVITSAPPTFGDEPPTSRLRQVQVMRDETEVEATRRVRDAVLANISHEFRTPLSAQLASIELLLDQLPDLTREQIGELVLALQRGTLRLTQLIDNLLESVRLEAGHYSLRHHRIALDAVIEQALELTRPLLAQREQEVVVELPYPLPATSGDAPRLTQVFVNLLANANKFAPPHTLIRIGGTVTVEAVILWVEDQGPGLPPSTDTALFAPFMRSLADEPEPGGVGLGLWIVKSVVERHGGHVLAESRPEGGTRMSVWLPREQGSLGEDISR